MQNARSSSKPPHELALAKQILRLGEVIELVGRELKPHHLATYLYELATRFSGFFENCPVIQSDEPVRSSRLALVELTARTIAWAWTCSGSSTRTRCDHVSFGGESVERRAYRGDPMNCTARAWFSSNSIAIASLPVRGRG